MLNQRVTIPRLNRRGAFALTGAAACWGIATVMTKALLATFPPITLLTVQLIASIILLWTIVFATAQTIPHYRQLIAVGLLGLLNPGIAYALSLLGLRLTTASMSTLLWASEPALIMGLAWLFFHERLMPQTVIFIAVAMGGVLLISLAGQQLAGGSAIGNLLILGGVCCCAFYTVLAQDSHLVTTPLVAVTLQQTFACFMTLAILPLEIGRNPAMALSLPTMTVTIGIYAEILCSDHFCGNSP